MFVNFSFPMLRCTTYVKSMAAFTFVFMNNIGAYAQRQASFKLEKGAKCKIIFKIESEFDVWVSGRQK